MKHFIHIQNYILSTDEIERIDNDCTDKNIYILSKDGSFLRLYFENEADTRAAFKKAVNDLTTPKAIY